MYPGDKTDDVVCKHYMMCCGVMDRLTSLATVQHVKRNCQYNNHVNSKQRLFIISTSKTVPSRHIHVGGYQSVANIRVLDSYAHAYNTAKN